jgi:hypothetical protein
MWKLVNCKLTQTTNSKIKIYYKEKTQYLPQSILFVIRILQGSPGQSQNVILPTLPKQILLLLTASVVTREYQVGAPSVPV